MALRLREGLDLGRYSKLSGQAVSAEAVSSLDALGLVRVEHERLRLTRRGRPLIDRIVRDLALS